MLVSRGHATSGTVLIGAACTAIWRNGDIQTQLQQRVMSGPVVLLQLRSVSPQEAIGTMRNEVRGPC